MTSEEITKQLKKYCPNICICNDNNEYYCQLNVSKEPRLFPKNEKELKQTAISYAFNKTVETHFKTLPFNKLPYKFCKDISLGFDNKVINHSYITINILLDTTKSFSYKTKKGNIIHANDYPSQPAYYIIKILNDHDFDLTKSIKDLQQEANEIAIDILNDFADNF